MKRCGKRTVPAMSNKKNFSKLAVLSLLGILSLTACDSSDSEIVAKPSNYNDPIVDIQMEDFDSKKIQNDIMSIIDDQIHDNGIGSQTLDKVLYRYAQSVFGVYNKEARADNDTSITLKAAVASAKLVGTQSKDDAKAFIRAHKAYWTYDDNGKHINDDVKDNPVVVTDDKNFEPAESEYARLTSRYDEIEDRVAESMFNKSTAGSYTDNHFFKEIKYLKSLYEDKQDVANYRVNGELRDIPGIIVDYTVEGKDVFNEGILTREFYQTNYALNEDESADPASGEQHHYIEKVIIPEVYGDLLVEQYLLDEDISAIRNSRARQINVIKIEEYSGFRFNANLLAKKLVEEIYSTIPAATDDHLAIVDEDHNPYEEIFERYATISKGLYDELYDENGDPLDPKADEIIKSINASRSDAFEVKEGAISGKKYFANTTYGDLVEEYEDLLKAESFDEIDKDLYDKYTNSGKRSFEEGFDQEVISIDQTKSITKGWYIQKSAPSLDTNGKIVNNLFQLSVANNKIEISQDPDNEQRAENLEKLAEVDRVKYDDVADEWVVRDEPAPTENKYICSINGAYFLKFDGQAAGSGYKYTDDILYYDGSAYYVVQVLEAVKDVKLRNKTSVNSYARSRSAEFLNDVLAQITKKVAETGNYSSLSKEHWLEKMNIKYHDQSVYDYFKDNYPSLFED